MFYLNGAHVRNYASHSICDTESHSELQHLNNKVVRSSTWWSGKLC